MCLLNAIQLDIHVPKMLSSWTFMYQSNAIQSYLHVPIKCYHVPIKCYPELGPTIKGLVTDGNTKLCCRGFVLALFQSTTADKIDSEHI